MTTHTRRSLTDGFVLRWTAVIVVARVLALVATLAAFDGLDEPSRDLGFHWLLAETPGNHLTHPTAALEQYPPLLGAAEALTYQPWAAMGVSPATSLRLGAVVWDVVAGWFVLATVAAVRRDRVGWTALVYGFLPLTWVASAGAGQDEAIGAAFIAAALWCVVVGRPGWARGVGVVGLFAAKLLIVPVLVALVVARPSGQRRREAVTILGLVATAMAVLWAWTGRDGLTNQMAYKPEWITFSVNPWGWLATNDVVASRTAHVGGQLLAAVATVGALFVLLRRSEDASRVTGGQADGGDDNSTRTLTAAHVVSVLLLTAFALLAVVNPEYLSLAVPALLLVATGADVAWMTGAVCLAWATDYVFAVIRRNPVQEWPLIGELTVDADGREMLSNVHLGLAIATAVVLLTLAARLIVRPASSAPRPGD